MRPQPLICVNDVEVSSRWYQKLLGARSDHGGPHDERLVDREGRLILQLHAWETDHDLHLNPPDGQGGPNHREIWLRDRDGYGVVVCSPDGSG